MKIFLIFAAILYFDAVVEVNSQSSLFTTLTFRNLYNYDVNAAVPILSSQTAINNYFCTYMCMINPNCALVVFKSGNVCNLYSISALTSVIKTSSGIWLYQQQIAGWVNRFLIH
jgi:hypothetical protein